MAGENNHETRLTKAESEIEVVKRDLDDLRTRNTEAHSKFYDGIAALTNQQAASTVEYRHILESITELRVGMKKDTDAMRADIQEIKDKPAKRWDGALQAAVTAGAGAIVGAFISSLAR